MIKRTSIIFALIFIFLILVLSGCNRLGQERIRSVGMLVEHSINDQTWGNKGYEGLLKIKDEFNVDVFFKEEVQTQREVNIAVEEFVAKGVNVIFGHSSIYGKMFQNISRAYPDVQFIYFNGGYTSDNLTSLNFSSHSMGFFAGMIAGEMTRTNHIGMVAAYEWQPEVEGFYEGVNYQNPRAKVHMEFVNEWDNVEQALTLFERINSKGADVYYPAGDSFSIPVIDKVKELDKYAIGFVSDQIHLGEATVLTSTVQHVDQLYLLVARSYNEGNLNGGVITYDFQEDVISLGEFSDEVPDSFKKYILKEIEEYKETGLLPYER